MRARTDTLQEALHVFALTALAIAQPILDLLARQSEFLVAHKLGAGEFLSLAVVLTFVLPASLVAVRLALGRLSAPLGRALHLVTVVALFALVVLMIVKRISGLSSVIAVGIALIGTTGLGWAYSKNESFRSVLTVLSISPVVVLVKCLASAQVRPLVFPPETVVTAGGQEILNFPNFARLGLRTVGGRQGERARLSRLVSLPDPTLKIRRPNVYTSWPDPDSSE